MEACAEARSALGTAQLLGARPRLVVQRQQRAARVRARAIGRLSAGCAPRSTRLCGRPAPQPAGAAQVPRAAVYGAFERGQPSGAGRRGPVPVSHVRLPARPVRGRPRAAVGLPGACPDPPRWPVAGQSQTRCPAVQARPSVPHGHEAVEQRSHSTSSPGSAYTWQARPAPERQTSARSRRAAWAAEFVTRSCRWAWALPSYTAAGDGQSCLQSLLSTARACRR